MSRRRRIMLLRERAQMIFQDPYESLNPRQTIFDIVAEPLQDPRLAPPRRRTESTRVRAALETCGLAPADHFWGRYPAELSGGQRQRVVIAGALVLEPDLLVADEPVSMLDVSIRAEILSLLHALRDERDITILYTTHDLATAGYFTDRMAVMYLGRIVELGPTTAGARASRATPTPGRSSRWCRCPTPAAGASGRSCRARSPTPSTYLLAAASTLAAPTPFPSARRPTRNCVRSLLATR